jgi:hypothetical protein
MKVILRIISLILLGAFCFLVPCGGQQPASDAAITAAIKNLASTSPAESQDFRFQTF